MRNQQSQSISVSKATAGAAVYTKFVLFIYDALVMRFENPFVWGCPTRTILDFYNRHISSRHLDVGVGSGYFLDKSTFPSESPMIHLLDLNMNSLEKTAKRIGRYQPTIHQWNVLEPIEMDLPEFDSIGIGYLLHCLPGDFHDKEIVLKNLKRFLSKNGTLFGSTILGKDVNAGFLYRLFHGVYNKWSILSNSKDDLIDLEKILKSNFSRYELDLVGSVALFSCRK